MTKKYTDADAKPWAGGMGITVDDHHNDLEDLPPKRSIRDDPQWDGYGDKIPTDWRIHFNNRYYRVYATCYSNVASHWFVANGKKIFIH